MEQDIGKILVMSNRTNEEKLVLVENVMNGNLNLKDERLLKILEQPQEQNPTHQPPQPIIQYPGSSPMNVSVGFGELTTQISKTPSFKHSNTINKTSQVECLAIYNDMLYISSYNGIDYIDKTGKHGSINLLDFGKVYRMGVFKNMLCVMSHYKLAILNPYHLIQYSSSIDGIRSFIVYNDYLYVGHTEGITKFWIHDNKLQSAKISDLTFVRTFAIYNGKIHFGADSDIYTLDENDKVELCPSNIDSNTKSNIRCMIEYNGYLYTGYTGIIHNTIKCWDKNYKHVATLESHKSTVTDLMVHNNHLFSTSLDNKIIVWNNKNEPVFTEVQQKDTCNYGLVVYNDKLYAGNGTSLQVYNFC